MDTYTVRQDNLSTDLILYRRYGRRGQALVEATMVANPGLAALGPILPVGTVLLIPDLPAPTTRITDTPVDLFG